MEQEKGELVRENSLLPGTNIRCCVYQHSSTRSKLATDWPMMNVAIIFSFVNYSSLECVLRHTAEKASLKVDQWGVKKCKHWSCARLIVRSVQSCNRVQLCGCDVFSVHATTITSPYREVDSSKKNLIIEINNYQSNHPTALILVSDTLSTSFVCFDTTKAKNVRAVVSCFWVNTISQLQNYIEPAHNIVWSRRSSGMQTDREMK